LESASELEDSLGHQLERISKEQLYTAYHKVQARYTKYKGRYADLARHYRELDRENVKAKVQNLKAIYYVCIRNISDFRDMLCK